MAPLQKMRRGFIIALSVLAVIAAVFAGSLLWPGTSGASERAEEQSVEKELRLKRLQAAPLHGIEKKLVDSGAQIKQLYAERVASRWSGISERIQKLAQETGVSAQSIRYKTDPTGLPNLQRVNIETTIGGDYAKIPHFINALERDKLLFLITQISVTGQEGGMVQLQIRFDTFLKETA